MTISPNTIKICSLRDPDHAGHVVDAGADLFGLIFANVRRQVSEQQATEIATEARRLAPGGGLRSVGVFVEHSAAEINRIAERVGLDLVQLHRSEVFREGVPIERPVLLAVRTAPGTTVEYVDATVAALVDSGSQLAGLIVDGYKAGAHGGSGTKADWVVAREIAARYPTLLAGGLTPDNVVDAIHEVRPHGVDVSSGVETDGEKDRRKISAFVRNARAALGPASLREVDDSPLGQAANPIQGAQSLL